jgi:hypothetical protein
MSIRTTWLKPMIEVIAEYVRLDVRRALASVR